MTEPMTWHIYLHLNWYLGTRVKVRVADAHGRTIDKWVTDTRFDEPGTGRAITDRAKDIIKANGGSPADHVLTHRIGLMSRNAEAW